MAASSRKGTKIGAYKIGDVVGYEFVPFNGQPREYVGVIARAYRQVGGAGVFQIRRLNTNVLDIEIEESAIKGTL